MLVTAITVSFELLFQCILAVFTISVVLHFRKDSCKDINLIGIFPLHLTLCQISCTFVIKTRDSCNTEMQKPGDRWIMDWA